MELSIFLAKFLGLYMLTIAAIWLLRKEQIEKAIRDIVSSGSSFALTGILHTLVGLAIVISHPILTFSWQGFITLLGFASIFHGIARLAVPEIMRAKILTTLNIIPWIFILNLLVLGAFLTYKGFVN